MDFLIAVAGKVADYTVAPIGRQVGYLIFYNANFKELTDRVSDLVGKGDEIKHLVEEERRNGKEIETGVQNWLNSVDGLIGEANLLQQDPHHKKVGCSGGSFPNLVKRHQLSRKATKMAARVVQEQRRGGFDRVAYLPALNVASTSANRGFENFESRKSIKEDIMNALRDPKLSMIGVYGLGGVGKTTLMKEIADIAKQDNLFDVVVTAPVSKSPDLKKIQLVIADNLGLRFVEETVNCRAPRLHQRIKSEKTILIILDDIWKRLDLEEVGIPFGDAHNGCKLLMTSRNLDVLQQMGTNNNFRLEVLKDEETWSLFKENAGNIDDEFIEIASQVANKCGGLPVIVVAMARSLMDKGIHAWKDALNWLERVDIDEEMKEITYSALEFTYKRLRGNEMKKFFLLCAVVDERPFISDLFKYGIGLGIFINNTNTLEGAKNRLYNMISALKASCLLLEEDTSTWVKMHDVVREVAISIASRDEHMLIKMDDELNEWPTVEFLRKCSQIHLDFGYSHICSKPPEILDCPNLELFRLGTADCSLEFQDTIFERMENLKVMDLTGMNFPSLPTSLCFLTGIQTLCLDSCVLENMEAIGALKNLEILSLMNSSMIKLPGEIGKLNHLRMLDLSNSGMEVIPPDIISSLIKLEELYMGNTSIKWEVENSASQNKNASLVELGKLSNLTALELQVREAWMLPRDLMFEKLERYKIVIGDVWEWSDIHYVTLKTLKLKLGTDIHLEHWIKALTKRVENLYLDEVEGISNVLYQLNREGFPQLKHLHIQNNGKIKHIIDSVERNHVPVSFPNLETLVIQSMNNMEKICHGPLAIDSFANLKVIRVKKCTQLKYLLSFSMVKGLSRLSKIKVSQCNFMESVVLADNEASADDNRTVDKIEFLSLQSLTLQHLSTLDSFFSYELTSSEQNCQRSKNCIPIAFLSAQVSFPNLDTLKLRSLNLSKIWEDNQHVVHKIKNLIVESCDGLNYLFSSFTVGSFPNLIRLEISDCSLMEEIIATKERNHCTAASGEVRFSKLETIILKGMKSLKTIWHSQFDRLKTLQVQNCAKIGVVFPSSMQKTYHNLEKLVVTDCASVEEIFAFTSNENCGVEDRARLKRITLERLPQLKQTWSIDPQGLLRFPNLEDFHINDCGNLSYLFPLSVASYCSLLKGLTIQACANMKEIIAQKEGSICTNAIFEFNQLNTLVLGNLPRLKGFYAENHTLSCPSLRMLVVFNCLRLNLFRTLSTNSNKRFPDGKLNNVSVQQSPFIVEQVIPNLEILRTDQEHIDKILQAQNKGALFTRISDLELSGYKNEDSIFPDWFLQNIYTLKELRISWSSFKTIFQDERPLNGKNCTQLKELQLCHLPELQHICEEGLRIDPILEFVEHLHVDGCSSMINVVPSSVRFSHLRQLCILNCNGMINLISSTTASSLVKLKTMRVIGCNLLQEIVAEKGDDIVYDIVFPNLEFLMLECLPRLNSFSSSKCALKFPLLSEVVVMQCPRLKNFFDGDISTPKLQKVRTEKDKKEWQWKGDLNGTIKNMFEDKVAFHSFKDLNLSKYPELKELWYGQLQEKFFSNLKNLVVHKCDFLSNVLFQPNLLDVLQNLEELDVRDCDSLEAVFNVKEIFAKETLTKRCTLLKKLKVSNLPKLNQVWKEDPCSTLSFQNLCEVSVMECQSLTSLFPLSVARDIAQLQELKVLECGIEEIVAYERGTEDMNMIKFVFPHLTYLQLQNLPKLKSFCSANHSLQVNSLKSIDVLNCQKLDLFKAELESCQEEVADDTTNISMGEPLFILGEVIPNLEILRVDQRHADKILQSQNIGAFFIKLSDLELHQFESEDSVFPDWFLQNANTLKRLGVAWSSFKNIFKDERPLIGKSCTQIKVLALCHLPELQYICEEGLRIDPVLEFVEHLHVHGCSSVINVVPSSVRFSHLRHLEILNCNGMINLIASPTASSLAKLTTMKVTGCISLQEIIADKGDDIVYDIVFPNLEFLMLECLPRLNSFCSSKCTLRFPLLSEVVVTQCPRIKNFSEGDISTPKLQKVRMEEDKKEWQWKGDLNTTIENMFEDKVAFHSFKDLNLSEYPELKELWYGQLQQNVLSNLKNLVVHKCDFLSNVLFQPNLLDMLLNLEELDVRDCKSLEAVFDVKGIFAKETLTKRCILLKKLKISSLPKLKHVWKDDPCSTLSFRNLCEVSVMECQSLESLFPLSVARDITQLQELKVLECGIEEIVTYERGTEDMNMIKFVFPHLTYLQLRNLPELKSFCTASHSLQFNSLKSIDVLNCQKLDLFKVELESCQEEVVDDTANLLIDQPLFTLKEVSPNLKELSINGKDALMIFSGHCEENIFPKVEILHLQCFNETHLTFWNEFLDIFPSLVMLQVRNCCFEMLFSVTRTAKQVKKLWLFELEHLKHIWHGESPLHQLVAQNLEALMVCNCPTLTSLVPSSMSFRSLNDLSIENCQGLIYLITSSVAKSLRQLTKLKVKNCWMIKDIIKIDNEEADNAINFENLEKLELVSLSSLTSFCSGNPTCIFPSLVRVIVVECPQIKSFSSRATIAPLLTNIEVENQRKRWKDDLNTTIEKLFLDKQEVSYSIEKQDHPIIT